MVELVKKKLYTVTYSVCKVKFVFNLQVETAGIAKVEGGKLLAGRINPQYSKEAIGGEYLLDVRLDYVYQ
jgi:hypothetical protein